MPVSRANLPGSTDKLLKGEATPQSAFSRALGVVNQYFLPSNSFAVNRMLMETE